MSFKFSYISPSLSFSLSVLLLIMRIHWKGSWKLCLLIFPLSSKHENVGRWKKHRVTESSFNRKNSIYECLIQLILLSISTLKTPSHIALSSSLLISNGFDMSNRHAKSSHMRKIAGNFHYFSSRVKHTHIESIILQGFLYPQEKEV